MSHTYEKVSGNKAKLTFTIPAEQFDEAMQKLDKVSLPAERKSLLREYAGSLLNRVL